MNISVIIPIYNTPIKLLQECLSQLSKFGTELIMEFVMINDGSTQEQVENLCLKFNKKDQRFKYIFQSNQGVSAARNRGVAEAQYDWVIFLDPDDTLKMTNPLQLVAEADLQTKCDLILFPFLLDNKLHNRFPEKFTGRDLTLALLKIDDGSFNGINSLYASTCWGKIYKKSIILHNNLFLTELFKREDVAFNFGYYFDAQNIGVTSAFCYSYSYFNENSISFTYKKGLLNNYVKLLQHLIYLNKHNSSEYEHLIKVYTYNLFSEALSLEFFCRENKSKTREKVKHLNTLFDSINAMVGIERPNPTQILSKGKYFQYLCIFKKKFYLLAFLFKLKNAQRFLRDKL